jgi:ribosome-binding protein aMBF1 (putative translation factor)
MAAAVIEEPQVASEVAALSDDTRKEIVGLREGGMTLAELKARFPQLTGDQIRSVLPPANKREATQREAKSRQPKAKATGKGSPAKRPTGRPTATGQAAAAKSEPTPKAARYVEDADLVRSLAERTVAARQVMGRNALAEALGVTGSACWRFERGRIHPTELEPLYEGIAKVEDRIAAGEFVKAERQPKVAGPSKAEALHRLEVVSQLARDGRGAKTAAEMRRFLTQIIEVISPPADAP